MATLAAARFQGIRSTHCAREGPGSNGGLCPKLGDDGLKEAAYRGG